MSESLPSIGAHCSVKSCNINDFLPIRCKCEKLFCRDHIVAENHECPVKQSPSTPTENGTQVKLLRCAAERCNKPSLEGYVANSTDISDRTPAVCAGCRKAFCAIHREAASHLCSKEYLPNPEPKNEAARELLAKNFSGVQSFADKAKTVAAPSTKPPTNAKKAAQLRQVQLMKMRHHAQPGDPRDKGKEVPLSERLHIIVQYENATQTVWFRKNLGTGRALDLLTARFNVLASDASYLHLSKVSLMGNEQTQLKTDAILAEQVDDGSHLLLYK